MWASVLVVAAGLMGAGGVSMLAAAAHMGGGDLARTGGTLLLIHAAAILAVAAPARMARRVSRGLLASAGVLACGTILFGADLALTAFMDVRPLAVAAPIGGVGMIAGWLAFAATGLASLFRPDE